MLLQENQDKALKMFENILDKNSLRGNIIRSSLFVLLFEVLKNFIIDHPRGLYCIDTFEMKDEKFIYKENEKYKQRVRALDSKIFPASVRWFQNHDALTEEEVSVIFKAEQRRNVFVHEIMKVLTEGCTEEDTLLFSDLASIYRKLDSWWIFNVEFDPDDVPNSEDVTQDTCCSMSAFLLQIIKDIALGNDEPYSGWMEQIREFARKQRKAGNCSMVSQSKAEKQEGKK